MAIMKPPLVSPRRRPRTWTQVTRRLKKRSPRSVPMITKRAAARAIPPKGSGDTEPWAKPFATGGAGGGEGRARGDEGRPDEHRQGEPVRRGRDGEVRDEGEGDGEAGDPREDDAARGDGDVPAAEEGAVVALEAEDEEEEDGPEGREDCHRALLSRHRPHEADQARTEEDPDRDLPDDGRLPEALHEEVGDDRDGQEHRELQENGRERHGAGQRTKVFVGAGGLPQEALGPALLLGLR